MRAELHELSAVELTGAIRRREVSAREALDAHFDRIDAVNGSINAVITEDREGAAALAEAADQLTMSSADLPPLHGLPMTHKDTHNTKGLRTTQGSVAFKDFVPTFDDLIIGRLKKAGVVTTGKTNVPEFAAGAHTFNELFGTTVNPYDTSRSAGGSSGGVAASIAARIQPLGEGSDMGGSLRNPASFCNIVGYRPSIGVVPSVPTRNAWAWLNRNGLMARDVEDIALGMAAIAGADPAVPYPYPVAGSFTAPLQRDLTGLRIGWSPDFGLGVPVDHEVLRVLEGQLQVFADLGAIVEEGAPDLRGADQVFGTTRAFDFVLGLGELVKKHGDAIKPEIRWNVEQGLQLTAQDMVDAALARTRLDASVRRYFGKYDVFASPTAQVLPFDASQRYPTSVNGVEFETYLDWMRSATLISATGLPAMSVPAGFSDDGLPVGLQLVMPHGKDIELLQVAYAFEQATGWAKRAPELQ
ncbi:amidase [Arthrobacter burdickii]|uniref:Amidase family protein n=1 Tax=Arthrobacter burdickii TaxID=3035920 RepID=A0ABT8K4G2_9MICC|nr:amidase family protein [Arthrobacter burdickii]MDN4612354.1 amidase family protein [Arthrobacter burdickii]